MSTQSILVMDVKSSGCGAQQGGFPVSIGIAGFNDQQAECWSWLVCPLEYWRLWDDAAEEVHGLSRDHLIDCGIDPFLVCRSLNADFAGRSIYVGADSERSLIKKMFGDVGVRMAFTLTTIQESFSDEINDEIYNQAMAVDFTDRAPEDAKAMLEIIARVAL